MILLYFTARVCMRAMSASSFLRLFFSKPLTNNFSFVIIFKYEISRCGSAWGRARPLPVADKGSAKEWQPSQNASKMLFAKRDAVTATGISFVSLLSTQIQFHIEVWLSLVERYVRDVEVASSNLVTSTIKKRYPFRVPFLCACAWHFRLGCCFATTQVRFHRPEICKLACKAQGA